jgi:cytoskeletal protein CcmA (bactofilin family)
MAQLYQNKEKNITVLGTETEFIGELTFKDNLVITGKFNGTINATGDLEISKEAVCNVSNISVNSVIISGKVRGDILSQKFVEMKNGSTIQGNVTTSRIRIEDGVDFQGKISMVESAEKTDLFSMNSSEYKDSLTLYQSIDKK